MFKKFLYAIVIAIVLFVVIGFFLPRYVHVERSINIDRPAALVFSLVNGYQTFNSWSPWAARDESATYVFSGPATGVGARMEWEGDPRLSGSGSQEIIESTPYSLVRARLQFDQQGEAIAYYDIRERDEGGVTLTWGFDTDLTAGQSLLGGLMARYFGLLFDRWIGSDYEQGLASLKTLAESLPDADFSDLDAEVIDVEPMDILYVSSASSQEPGDIAQVLASSYQKIMLHMAQHDIQMSGQPMSITHSWDEGGYAFDAAIPARLPPDYSAGLTEGESTVSGSERPEELSAESALPQEPEVKAGVSPSGKAVRVIHRGPYDQMLTTYEKLAAYMTTHGLEEGSVSWEQYVSDPGQTPESELVTYIYFMIDDTTRTDEGGGVESGLGVS